MLSSLDFWLQKELARIVEVFGGMPAIRSVCPDSGFWMAPANGAQANLGARTGRTL